MKKYYTHACEFPSACFNSEDNRYFFFYEDTETGEIGILFTEKGKHEPADGHFSEMYRILIRDEKVKEVEVLFGFWSELYNQKFDTVGYSTYEGTVKDVSFVARDSDASEYGWEDKTLIGVVVNCIRFARIPNNSYGRI